MPYMKLHRNFTLATTRGAAIEFKKDTPVYVPNHLVKDCIAIGADYVDEKDKQDFLPAEKEAAPALTEEERTKKFFAAFDKIVELNSPRDFGANGAPTPKAVERETGFTDVDNKELKTFWARYRLEKAEAQ